MINPYDSIREIVDRKCKPGFKFQWEGQSWIVLNCRGEYDPPFANIETGDVKYHWSAFVDNENGYSHPFGG